MKMRLLIRFAFIVGLSGLLFLPAGNRLAAQEKPANPALQVTDNLSTDSKELYIETADWKIGFSLYFNGGIFRIWDKVADPEMKDNLVTGPNYCQGGLFDLDVYLSGQQEFMTTMGKNRKLGGEKLELLESTPVRVRLRQTCHPRLNNGAGPPGEPYIELEMVETTTEWTFYSTGRVAIKFDAVVPPEWTGIVSEGPGGEGKGISTDGYVIKPANGTSFSAPWVTMGDTIESKSGGWGPLEIARRPEKNTLRIPKQLPKGENLDFIIRRPNITNETISIHADGGTNKHPREQCWLGGSNGVPIFNLNKMGDIQRGNNPPLSGDYVFAHWTVEARGFGSMLAFFEPYNANFAVVNDFDWGDISYTQYGRGGTRPFEPHHRHLLAQIGIENGKVTPKIKGIPDSLPFADDYLHPYAEARTGTLNAKLGYNLATGAYEITAKNKIAAIAFDAARGKTVSAPLAYQSPAVLVLGLDVADNKLIVELSKDNGKTYKPLAASGYNVTTQAQAAQLGAKDRRLIQILDTVPAESTGAKTWVVRLRSK
jgi:hypothetical protein